MARKDRINQKPLHNPLLLSFIIRGVGGGLLIFDVNITTEKVNEKNPLEMLNYPIKRPVPYFRNRPMAPFKRPFYFQ